MTTKECLHRFCQECIITALRSGNKECPTCRKKLVSKRSLRPDPNFDALISKIYPSRDEYEAHQERVLAKLKQHHNTSAFSHSIEEGIRLQALNRAQRVRKHASDTDGLKDGVSSGSEAAPRKRARAASEESGDSLSVSGSIAGSIEGGSDAGVSETPTAVPQGNEIELVFKPHPSEEMSDCASQTRYIKTTSNATGMIWVYYSSILTKLRIYVISLFLPGQTRTIQLLQMPWLLYI